jgi:hypothetical protein
MERIADKESVRGQLLATLVDQAQVWEQIANSSADRAEAERFRTFAQQCRAAVKKAREADSEV